MFKTERERINYLLSKKETRVALCEERLDLFAFYYFRQFFTHKTKDFHFEWYKDALEDKNILNIWFRDSWKTAILWLIYIIYCICYSKYYFIVFYAFEKDKAKAKTLNIVNLLKSNKFIKEDFWYLFKDNKVDTTRKDNDSMQEQKTIEEFITTNWIKVKAMSMNMSPRWEQFVNKKWEVVRPELLVLDDIDINKSVRNIEVIDNNYAFVTWEIMWWVWVWWKIIFLWNIIWEDWVIPRLLKYQKDNDSWIVRETTLIDENESIRWPEKFVWTDEEANRINEEITDKRYYVVSLESKMKDQWLNAFNSNYRNQPYQIIWDPVFTQENVNKLKEISPISWFNITVNWITTRLQIYNNCYKDEPLIVWIDVWWGIWKDFTEFTFKNSKKDLVATWSSNKIKPWFIWEVLTDINDRIWFDFYRNAIVIENNNHWHVVIDRLRTDNPYLYRLLFKKNTDWSAKFKSSVTLGWTTSWPSKEILIWDLIVDIDNLETVVTKDIKSQMKTYIIDEDWKYNAQYGAFDDKIISYALADQWTRYFRN